MRQFVSNLEKILFYALLLLLPVQLGKHFWPSSSFVHGLRIDYLSPTLYLTDIIVGLLFVVWAIRAFGARRKAQNLKQQLKTKSFLSFTAAFLFLVFNVFQNAVIEHALYYVLKILEMGFVVFYIAKFVDLKKDLVKVISILGLGSVFESILAIAQFFNKGSIGGVLYYLGERTFTSTTPGISNASIQGELVLRPYATFPHPNVLAGYLVVVMTLVLFLFVMISKKQKTISYQLSVISYLILSTFALFLTLSRIAVLVWVLVLGFVLVKKILSSNVVIKQVGNMLTIFIIIAFVFFTPLFSRFLETSIREQSVVQRKELINASVEMVKEKPFTGVGLGNFIPTLVNISGPLKSSTYLQPVHNIYLLVAAETGLIGLGFFLIFLYKTFKKTSHKLHIISHMRLVFLIILVLGMFDHYFLTLQQGQLLFVVVLGLCWTKNNFT